jgi:CelD/BcsL family acetyltransferase involved in cellulose biosynthesis
MLTAEIIKPDALRRGDAEAWAAFREADPAFANPLIGPRWAQAVGRVRADAAVAVLKRDGRTVGILAHHRGRGGLARPIGAPFSDIHALLAAPDDPMSLADAVAAAGLRSFRFTGLLDPQDRAHPMSEPVVAHLVERAPGDDVAEMIRARHAKRIKNYRRLGHKLDREVGPVRLKAHDPSPSAFQRLLGWQREQLLRSGLHDVYRPAWVQTLLGGLMAAPDPEFGGLLVTLSAGDQLTAAEFGLREGSAFHPWIAAYDPQFSAYSPGILLQLHLLERLEPLEISRYDLGVAADHYKAALTTGRMTVGAGILRARADARLATWRSPLERSRLSRRWDQIDAVETTTMGRLNGVLHALRSGRKRLSTPA